MRPIAKGIAVGLGAIIDLMGGNTLGIPRILFNTAWYKEFILLSFVWREIRKIIKYGGKYEY